MNPNTFVVLGDLGDGFFIVRMFVGEQTFDEEIESSLTELRATVEARMVALAKKPDASLLVEGAERPAIDPGHAIEVPE